MQVQTRPALRRYIAQAKIRLILLEAIAERERLVAPSVLFRRRDLEGPAPGVAANATSSGCHLRVIDGGLA